MSACVTTDDATLLGLLGTESLAHSARPMRVVLYAHHRDPEPTALDLLWPELVLLLAHVTPTTCTPCKVAKCSHPALCCGKTCPQKHGEAWSPVVLEGSRANDNVREVTVAVFDLDHVTDETLDGLAEHIDGLAYVVHSTHNHNPPNDQALRLVVPLSRPATSAEWPAVLRAAVHAYGIPADRSCKDLSRLYFLPTCPKHKLADALALENEGAPLDVDAMLALAPSVPVPVKAPLEYVDDGPDEPPNHDAPVNMAELRKCLKSARKKKAGSTLASDATRYELLGNILQGKPLCGPDDFWNTTVNMASSLLAFLFPAGTPTQACLETLRPSIAAMDVIDTTPKGVDFWLEVAESSYDRAAERRAIRDADYEARTKALAARMVGLVRPTPAPPMRAREPSASASETASEDAEDANDPVTDLGDDAWLDHLLMRADKTPKSCGENVVIILCEHPDMRGRICWNEVEKTIVVKGGPFAGIDDEDLAVAVTDWLCRNFGMSVSEQVVGSRLLRVARANSFDPLKDYLRALAWDQTNRLDEWLIRYCGAATKNVSGDDITDHIRRVSRKWMVAAVARALDPGCQADTVLILEGEQGLKKTSALRVLGGGWFCDTQLVLGDKDSMMLASANWIIELAELASLRKSETTAQRAFLTRRIDKYRAPYARTLAKAPRRCIFAGTINPEGGGRGDYLTDRTGNRRFWPVYCEEKTDKDALERDRDQLWAEAVFYYMEFKRLQAAGTPDDDNPHKWWLDDADEKVAEAEAADRLGDSPIESKIADWWFSMAPARRPELCTSTDVAENVLKYPIERINRSVQTEIGIAFHSMGFRKTRRMHNGRLTYLFLPTRELRDAKQAGHAPHLRAIVNATVKKDGTE